MDSNVHKKREKNPRENASWLSLLSFYFALKIFRKGFRREIQDDDIYKPIQDFSSEKMGNLLEKEWESKPKKSRIGFFNSILRIIWKRYAVLGLLVLFIENATIIAQPLLVAKVISYFTPGQTEVTLNDALLYIAVAIGFMIISNIYFGIYFLLLNELTLKVRTACCALIYRKCLKLSSIALSKCTNGLVVTLITKDLLQFDTVADCGLVIVASFFQLMIMTWLLYNAIGISGILGVSLLAVLFPVQGKFN